MGVQAILIVIFNSYLNILKFKMEPSVKMKEIIFLKNKSD